MLGILVNRKEPSKTLCESGLSVWHSLLFRVFELIPEIPSSNFYLFDDRQVSITLNKNFPFGIGNPAMVSIQN